MVSSSLIGWVSICKAWCLNLSLDGFERFSKVSITACMVNRKWGGTTLSSCYSPPLCLTFFSHLVILCMEQFEYIFLRTLIRGLGMPCLDRVLYKISCLMESKVLTRLMKSKMVSSPWCLLVMRMVLSECRAFWYPSMHLNCIVAQSASSCFQLLKSITTVHAIHTS